MGNRLEGWVVLVVGFDPVAGIAMHKLLCGEGTSVYGPFTSALIARSALRERHVVAAIMDLPLDASDAHELADALVSANVPFVWISDAKSLSAAPERFQKHPRLLKPFNDRLLLERLRKLITNRPTPQTA